MILFLTLNAKATSFKKDVLPIVVARCIQCHNESNMPDKNWLDYKIAKAKKDLIIKRITVLKDMPPYDNVTGITEDERNIIKAWILEGTKP